MKRILALLLVSTMLLTLQVNPVIADSLSSTPGSAISTGLTHSVVLKDDGTVWAWGGNECMQLGDSTDIDRESPIQVKGLTDVTAVSAGDGKTIVLRKDGTVWAWGANGYGLFGKRIGENAGTPMQIAGLENIIAISDQVALKSDGTVWEWGLRDDATNTYIPPVKVKGLTDIVEIASNFGFVHLALKKDGTVMMWNYYGTDMFGQLPEDTSDPVQVKNLSDVVSISAGQEYALALKKDGTVWTWGLDCWGEALHVGGNMWYTHFQDAPIPVQIQHIADTVKISAGQNLATVLKHDGTVWQWGYVSHESSIMPKQVKDLTNVVEISARWRHGVALKDDGTVWEWSLTYDVEQIPIKLSSHNEPQSSAGTTIEAITTNSKILVNGKAISFEVYTIESYNYFKLRDLAMAINGTMKQFEVNWDGANNAINLTTNKAYAVAGGELVVSAKPSVKEANPTTSKVYVNGNEVSITAYNIGESNYFKLRDIAKVIDFGVTWDGNTNTIGIDTSVAYND